MNNKYVKFILISENIICSILYLSSLNPSSLHIEAKIVVCQLQIGVTILDYFLWQLDDQIKVHCGLSPHERKMSSVCMHPFLVLPYSTSNKKFKKRLARGVNNQSPLTSLMNCCIICINKEPV